MAEYRRFISYIYAYEGDMKTKNVGFAKIEARNGQCRISISIKGAYECSGQELTLYGYGYEEDCLLIPLGQIPVKNGTGEAVLGKQEENLGGSGYGLAFLKGLYLRSKSSVRKAYLTTWDDTVIHITALKNAKIAGEEVLQAASLAEMKEPKPLTGMEVFQSPAKTKPTISKIESIESIRSMKEAMDRNLAALEPEAETAPEALGQRAPEETVRSEPEERQEPKRRTGSEERQKPKRLVVPEEPVGPERGTKLRMPPEETMQPERGIVPESEEEIKRETALEIGAGAGQEIRPKAADTAAKTEAAAASAGRMPENFYFREGFPELPLWECLQKILPRKRALAEAGWEVLQIHIQDIGRLPRENWPYGNNSFVLHGYFQYRYLILARRPRKPEKRFQSGYQYILGVPGIFKPQEKFMASMFGLPEFKRAAGNRNEDFGFWCGGIQM